MAPHDLLTALRDQNPLVHCITNYVAMNIAANVVLAAGASPAMVHAPEEIAEFTPICGALTINIGTISTPWQASMMAAAATASAQNIPWVLDPVAHFISVYRREAAQQLLAQRPTILRGNASEILALTGETGAGKGADSGDSVDAAQGAAKKLAAQFGTVVAITGPVDYLTDGTREAQVSGGSSLMPQVTALGCSQTALMGAYAATGPAFDAALAALAHFKVAGSTAAQRADGPGSFQMHFLDALANTQPFELAQVIR
ncbi:hydroxyethylthiazole kinase [Roseobacter denitrificans]|uniref:Hydroxyethylthiazole kinase n=1 Tax=Roseobacter denitrificans (strain ATCC 33942 / OCh 114) TaxID=375451 RepID=THIM_ROSDO|nr:hydroxyethylthiazole kinase [Roseobacter denitrificans]Q162K5.1 RecName: Full=Hydroxyethylthiazole kinase; AltName: Full=4-methyl-5-beta-hydroxyethylthiazole kinase; Short=TH kinase; Short=Thz kinase [Roseobacter denitrificans OCh 114]ABG33088.1 hydroxyethylthiazole kinase [Roseobacter denitrificans OCh 114]AVL52457.1 hydroxyethylthiazole kinase [Roseobacter denitrificans]SFG08182.1 hydroxyethylthiazole kinase [Roseobacter denitrificans OCh 114]